MANGKREKAPADKNERAGKLGNNASFFERLG
jgi:hypothetical protein